MIIIITMDRFKNLVHFDLINICSSAIFIYDV